MKIALTDREADIMQILWEKGASVVSEVQSELGDELAYTTVLTILRTLENKGYVTREAEGRGHRYSSSIPQQVARKYALNHLIGKLFKGSSELLFAQLVTDKDLTEEQIEHMRSMLQDANLDKEQ